MAFTYTVNNTVMGNKRVAFGTYTQADGDTGGDIVTGLGDISYFNAFLATAVDTDTAAGTATITTADPGDDITGFWMAIG